MEVRAARETSTFVRWFCGRILLSFVSPSTSRSFFARKAGTGIRTGVAFAVSATFASQPWASQLLGNPSWYVVFSVLFIRDSVGSTVQLIDSLYRCLTLTTLVDTAILATGIKTLSTVPLVVAVEAILFLTSLLYCYLFHDLNQKRYILSIHAVVLVQLVNDDAALFFPAQLLLCMTLAALGAIILVCLPYPRLASNELMERWRLAVSSLNEAMGEALSALESGNPAEVRVRLMEARFILASVLQHLPSLWRLQTEVSREAAVFRILFPFSPGFRATTQVDVGRCEEMHWVVANTCQLVEQLHASTTKHWASPACRKAIAAFRQEQSEWLSLISSEDMLAMNEAAVVTGRIRVGAVLHAVDEAILQADEADKQEGGGLNAAVLIRKALVFQLRRWLDAIVSLEVDTALAKEMTASHSASHTAFVAWKRLLKAQPRNPLHWSFFGLNPIQDLLRALTEMWTGLRHPGVDWPRLLASLKTAIILTTTAIIAVVPPLQQNWVFPEAVWAVYSYVNVISSNEGMLWGNSLHRLVGTFCGGIAGYLVLLAFGDGWAGAIAVLALWNFGLVWLESNLSNPASFSATIIVFGRHLSDKGNELSKQDYALTRMIEIGIGVVIAAAMSAVLFPVSSQHLIRQEWKGSITMCDEALKEAKAAYEQLVNSEEDRPQKGSGWDEQKKDLDCTIPAENSRGTDDTSPLSGEHLESLLSHTGNLGSSLSRQSDLLLNIRTEPVVLVVPPPFSAYSALMESIRAMWQLSLNAEAAARQLLLRRSLHGTSFDDRTSQARLFRPIVERVWRQNHQLLQECITVIDDPESVWDDGPQLAELKALTQELEGHVDKAASPSLSAFLYSLVRLSGETISLRRRVQILLKAERPKGFDD